MRFEETESQKRQRHTSRPVDNGAYEGWYAGAMAPNGQTCVHKPQPIHNVLSIVATSPLNPMAGHPIAVMHFLQPMHVSALIETGASGLMRFTHGARKITADGPSKETAFVTASILSSR